MIEADSRVDIFDRFGVSSLMEIMFLAVLKKYGRQGIGFELCRHSVDIARNLKHPLISALWTGINTQVIGKKLGFEVVYEESFSKFSFNGKTFTERVNNPYLTYHVAAKSLNQ
jgi:ribosomal protein S18 acetylase RimI-like enzyme